MPQRPYTWVHSEARLSAEERDELIRGLILTLGTGKDGD